MDARNLINREQIDAANIPVLFVELASGQNGTLTPIQARRGANMAQAMARQLL